MSDRWGKLLLLLGLSASLGAGELAPATAAKIIRVIVLGSGGSKVDCQNKEIAADLSGVAIDPEAKVAWADTDKDVARLAKLGKLVVCGNLDWLGSGASVAVVSEGGRPSITISPRNLATSGVTLPDPIVKISKVVK
jgi:hypothetical protein